MSGLSEPQKRALYALYRHRDSSQDERDRALCRATKSADPTLALYRKGLARPPGALTEDGALLAAGMFAVGAFKDATRNTASQELDRLRKFRGWGSNWDGEGAPKPKRHAIDAAIQLLPLVQRVIPKLKVALDADSNPVIMLNVPPWQGDITVEAAGTVSFHLHNGQRAIDDYDLDFNGISMPKELSNALASMRNDPPEKEGEDG